MSVQGEGVAWAVSAVEQYAEKNGLPGLAAVAKNVGNGIDAFDTLVDEDPVAAAVGVLAAAALIEVVGPAALLDLVGTAALDSALTDLGFSALQQSIFKAAITSATAIRS